LKKRSKDIEEILKTILDTKYERIGLTTHRNADPDAIASIYLLRIFLEQYKKETYIILPEGMNSLSKNVLSILNIPFEYYRVEDLVNIEDIPLFIVVDTSNSIQLGNLYKHISGKEYIVIDHHTKGDLVDNAYRYFLDKLVSCSEIMYLLLRGKLKAHSIVYSLLLTGILYDSRKFTYVDNIIFDIVSELINLHNADYLVALNSLKKEMDISEKIARIKGAQRTRILRANKYLVLFTNVSSFESSVARALLDLGADLVFVVSINNETRVVSRSTQRFYRETGISLGRDLIPKITKYLGGTGGGHDTAAVYIGQCSLEDVFNVVLSVLKEYFGGVKIV